MNAIKTKQQAWLLFQFAKKMRDHMLKTQMKRSSGAGGSIAEDLSPAQIHMLMQIKKEQQCRISELSCR